MYTRRGYTIKSWQQRIAVRFDDIRRPGDGDNEALEALVSGTSRTDLLTEVAIMLAEADDRSVEAYDVFWESQTVVAAVVRSDDGPQTISDRGD